MQIDSIINQNLPMPLTDEMKELIRNSFINAVENISENEIIYIQEKIKSKIEITKNAEEQWICNFSNWMEI